MALIGAFTRVLKNGLARFCHVQTRIPSPVSSLPRVLNVSLRPGIINEVPKMSSKPPVYLVSTFQAQNRRTIVSNLKLSNLAARHFSIVSPLTLNQHEKGMPTDSRGPNCCYRLMKRVITNSTSFPLHPSLFVWGSLRRSHIFLANTRIRVGSIAQSERSSRIRHTIS